MTRRPIAEMVSVGVAVPPGVLTNADLTRMLDTSDQWIVERTGIRERHIARPDQSVAMLSCEASVKALDQAGLAPKDIDAIVLATATPDRLLPSTACDLQALLGADRAAAFDISAACPGFLYATAVAEGMIAAGQSEVVLVVGCRETLHHHGLQGPLNRHSLRRRRRGRGVAAGPRPKRPGHSVHLPEVRRKARAPVVHPGWRCGRPNQRKGGLRAVALHEDGRPGGLQGRGADDGGGM